MPKSVNWLWKPYVPRGMLTLVMGDPEAGKSWLTLALAAAISTGRPMYRTPMPQGKVLLLSAEDSLAYTIRPRLDMLGADVRQIVAIQDPFDLDERGVGALKEAIEGVNPALVIIDPIIAYVGVKMDTNRANQVRHLLKQLKTLAEEKELAMAMVIHLRKEKNGSAIHGVQGSMDFIAASRSVLMVGKEPRRGPEERTMAQAKNSVAKHGVSLLYTIEHGRFEWLGESLATADDLSALPLEPDVREERHGAHEIVQQLLRGGDWVPSAQLIARATEEGIGARTLKRARAKLGVEVEQRADGWWCRLGQGALGDTGA